MIVKIQIPLTTTGSGEPQALVYDRAQTIKLFIPVALIASHMAGADKAFFYATVTDGELEIERDADWQAW